MARTFVGAHDVKNDVDNSALYEYQMTGADQRVSRDPDALAWLAKAHAEMESKKRAWAIFNGRRLGAFLTAAGVDVGAAAKAQDDSMPPPPGLADLGSCIGKLRGASFLNVSEQDACVALERVMQRSPHRR